MEIYRKYFDMTLFANVTTIYEMTATFSIEIFTGKLRQNLERERESI